MKININTLLIIILILICFRCCVSSKTEKEPIKITDTITIIRTDTIEIIKPQPVIKYRNKIVRDTLYSIDSVLVPVDIPLETKVYEDTTYRAVISGYKTELDSIYIYNKNQIHTINKIIYKTKKWSINPAIGVGYGAFNKKIDVYVGFSLNYNL